MPPSHSSELAAAQTERLGDAKSIVRQAAASVLATMLDSQACFAALSHLDRAWTHRNARARETAVSTLREHLAAHGGASLSKAEMHELVLAPLCGCLADSAAAVRAQALEALAAVHSHVGDGLFETLEGLGAQPAQLRELQARCTAGDIASESHSPGRHSCAPALLALVMLRMLNVLAALGLQCARL